MESWGCEFLEYEEYPAFQKENSTIYHLPISLVRKMINPETAQKILHQDYEYVKHLRYLINKDGLEYPGLVILATNGILLQDGNHRFFAVEDTYEYFPVRIRVSDRPLRIKSGSYAEVLKEILETL